MFKLFISWNLKLWVSFSLKKPGFVGVFKKILRRDEKVKASPV